MSESTSPDPYFPLRHLGLRGNPFQSLQREDWRSVAILPAVLEGWCAQPTPLLQISGEKGCGKTSALLALKETFSQRMLDVRYHYLPAERSAVKIELADAGVVLIDEAQRIPSRHRARLFKSFGSTSQAGSQPPMLVLATHEDFTHELQRLSLDFRAIGLAGYEAEDLARMLERRVRHFASSSSPEVRFTDPAVEFLVEEFSGHPRRIEDFLYDFFQAVPDDPIISRAALDTKLNG